MIGHVVNRMAGQIFEVHRRSGFYVHGEYSATTDEVFDARGNVQPSTPNDLQRLPEGSRTQGAITIWGAIRIDTGCLCRLSNGGSPNEVPDRILYDGTMYEVQSAEHWPRHSRYICSRAQQ